MLNTALSLPISQYYCVTMADISGIYSKRAYSGKLQHHSLVKVLGFYSSKTTSCRSYLESSTVVKLLHCALLIRKESCLLA